MTEPIDLAARLSANEGAGDPLHKPDGLPSAALPSNVVYARVGDVILRAAQDGVRRGIPPTDIIRGIVEEYNVRLNVGELRLLLASRPMTQPGLSKGAPAVP